MCKVYGVGSQKGGVGKSSVTLSLGVELSLKITDLAKAFIMEYGYDPVYGARPLKRFIQKHVDTLVARKMLEGSVGAGDVLTVDVENDKLVIAN